MKRRILVVCAQKGGVGKTTTVVNLAAALAERGHEVLVFDLDPQAGTTVTLGVDKRSTPYSVTALLKDDPLDVRDVILPTRTKGVDLVPGHINLTRSEQLLEQMIARETVLRDNTLPGLAATSYDFVLIDTPPSLGLLTMNGLSLADEWLLPIQAQYYSWEGVDQLAKLMLNMTQRLRHPVVLTGVLLTMFDRRTNLSSQTAREVTSLFGPWVFDAKVTINTRVAEAPSFRSTVLAHDPRGAGAAAYRQLAEEVVLRCPPWQPQEHEENATLLAEDPALPGELGGDGERRRAVDLPPHIAEDLARLQPLVDRMLGRASRRIEMPPQAEPPMVARTPPPVAETRSSPAVSAAEDEALWG
ncbi:MAG: ParA family protein [Candidatus Schekmanbacteria bacterium]|nr:ParA family protein [Candidatus Schekmanbacteria bacterium]